MTNPTMIFTDLTHPNFKGGESKVRHAMRRCFERYGVMLTISEYSRISLIAAEHRKADDKDWLIDPDCSAYCIGEGRDHGTYTRVLWRGHSFDVICTASRRHSAGILTFLPLGTFDSRPWYWASPLRVSTQRAQIG